MKKIHLNINGVMRDGTFFSCVLLMSLAHDCYKNMDRMSCKLLRQVYLWKAAVHVAPFLGNCNDDDDGWKLLLASSDCPDDNNSSNNNNKSNLQLAYLKQPLSKLYI